jgi:flagellar hook-associated protein 1 FlgK
LASIFSGLNTGISGLTSAQVGVNTTSHNISNAENENYTRQRVSQEALQSSSIGNALVGTGTSVSSITRVHSEFVYTRYQQSSERVMYANTLESNLTEIANFFPDMDGVGIKNDLEAYFSSWSALAQDPSSVSQKSILAAATENLTVGMKTSYEKLDQMHSDINEEIGASIEEANRIIKDIATLTGDILSSESNGIVANDLRDKRDSLETTLSRLVGAEFVHGNESDTGVNDPSTIEAQGLYTVMIGGVAVVTGTSAHTMTLDNKTSQDNFYTIKQKNSDGSYIDMTKIISKGKVGALLELRGDRFANNGEVQNGLIPDFKDRLNTLASGLIEHTNSLYAQSASDYMRSNTLGDVRNTDNVTEKLGADTGSFNIVIYDKDGAEVGKRVVTIDENTTFNASTDPDSLMAQLTKVYDDNSDGSLLNDFASQFKVSVSNDRLIIEQKNPDLGYTFGFEDNGTNFAGSIGMNRFFDGTDASNIALNRDLSAKPHNIASFKAPVDGDNGVADSMVSLQTDSWKFSSERYGEFNDTILGVYNDLTIDISSKTEAIISRKETIDVQFTAIESELNSISKVSIDNELVNLMKYQTAYSASGKVISTIDKMIDTLLGLKQ